MILKRLARLSSIFVPSLVLITSAVAQRAPISVTKDPQALTILTQVLANAGGVALLGGVQDFIGTGKITYSQPSTMTVPVIVRGTTSEQFRIDATLPAGVRSQAIANGVLTARTESGAVVPFQIQVPTCPGRVILPYLLVVSALSSPDFTVSYKGTVNLDEHSANQIEVQEVIPGLAGVGKDFREYHTVEFFVDSSTFQILMMQDTVPQHLVRQTVFSNYQALNGVLVPLSISEQSGGLPTWTIQLNQITFNSGLQDSDFQL
jgi:uncharacterized membrane protein